MEITPIHEQGTSPQDVGENATIYAPEAAPKREYVDEISSVYNPAPAEDAAKDEITLLVVDINETEPAESGKHGAHIVPTSSAPTTQELYLVETEDASQALFSILTVYFVWDLEDESAINEMVLPSEYEDDSIFWKRV